MSKTKTINQIVDYLDEKNIKKRNCEWTANSVKNIIKKFNNDSIKEYLLNSDMEKLDIE